MKTKRKQNISVNNELYNIFRDICQNEETVSEYIRDARKAFSLVQKDALYRNEG